MLPEPSFSIGVEEEYLIVDPETRDLASHPPDAVFKTLSERIGASVTPEFMRCQVEIGTPVCGSVEEARRELARLRRLVSGAVGEHGLAIIAASTHPFANWRPQSTTPRDRYQKLAADIGQPALRLMTCAMHVHVGVEDDDLRIDLMNQARYFLPHLLALSASSPFWQGQLTGLRSYRLAVFSEMPRTGVPEEFDSYGEYRRQLEVLVKTGVIEDGTKIWWDIRPSDRFPTLEMRITDICTRLEDGVALTALYVCILRMLWRLRRGNQRWRSYKQLLIAENRWRAMRYGADEGLIDFGKGEIAPYAGLLEEILELIAEDAEALGCGRRVEHARSILSRGTSSHRQQRIFEQSLAAGADRDEALRAVVDGLIAETLEGTEAALIGA